MTATAHSYRPSKNKELSSLQCALFNSLMANINYAVVALIIMFTYLFYPEHNLLDLMNYFLIRRSGHLSGEANSLLTL